MKPTDSPLRYPGGKSQFYGDLLSIFNRNQISHITYCEPFAGGAGVALRLLLEERVDNIIINDADYAIYSFWYDVLFETKWFIDQIRQSPLSLSEWKKQRAVLLSKTKNKKLLGFAAFYLNRTNRSGILLAGPIGGKKQDGSYLLDCRFNKENLIAKIQKIALFKKRITLEHLDGKLFIQKYASLPNAFWFIDPPYFVKGAALYQNFFVEKDHVELAQIIKSFLPRAKWILTYDVCDQIANLYSWAPSTRFSLTYSVQTKRTESEFLFWNNLNIDKGVIPNGFL